MLEEEEQGLKKKEGHDGADTVNMFVRWLCHAIYCSLVPFSLNIFTAVFLPSTRNYLPAGSTGTDRTPRSQNDGIARQPGWHRNKDKRY